MNANELKVGDKVNVYYFNGVAIVEEVSQKQIIFKALTPEPKTSNLNYKLKKSVFRVSIKNVQKMINQKLMTIL